MQRLKEFRIFYNHTIHPELMRLERNRIRLLRLFFLSGFLLAGLIALQIYLNLFVITLVLMIPITGYIGYLFFRIRKFTRTFKPRVVNLVLDFIDDALNRGTMTYEYREKIPRERFIDSGLFDTAAPFYEGEDHIEGKVGEVDFELCELDVREHDAVTGRMEEVFRGVFLSAVFPEDVTGNCIVWPRHRRQYLTRSIKAFVRDGGKNVDHEIMDPAFRKRFLTYATRDTHVAGILSEPMQEALVQLHRQLERDIYLSFKGKLISAAIDQPRDLLEPHILRSNLSFDLVREFFEDINSTLRIVEIFDQTH